ncbi:MAG: Clp protease N-terminal domain-containing protein [Spirulinaceae cyanobacterium]
MPHPSLEHYSQLMAALGQPHRLGIVHCLIEGHPQAQRLGDLQKKTQLPLAQLQQGVQHLIEQEVVQLETPTAGDRCYRLNITLLEDLLAFFYAECCVRQRILDWGNVISKKDRLLAQAEIGNVEKENLANFLDAAIYERLGGKVLQVLLLARSEAERLRQMPINTAHMLLGLCLEGGNTITHRLLKRWQLDVVQIRNLLKTITLPQQFLPEAAKFTPEAITSLKFALDEATEMGDILINTEHLLVGIIREWELSRNQKRPITMAAQLLHQTGMTPAAMLTEIRSGLPNL